MDSNKKFLPVIKVGGRRVVKKRNEGRKVSEKLKKLIDENKKRVSKSSIGELTMEKESKIYKYKNNIKVIFDEKNNPIGFLVTGFPDVKNKIVTYVPDNFEEVVDKLNSSRYESFSKLEEALDID